MRARPRGRAALAAIDLPFIDTRALWDVVDFASVSESFSKLHFRFSEWRKMEPEMGI